MTFVKLQNIFHVGNVMKKLEANKGCVNFSKDPFQKTPKNMPKF